MKINKVFNVTSEFKVKKASDGSITIRGFASTSDIDRAGDVIIPEAWTKGGLDNFKRNPIILFNHNYDRPIGKATSIEVTDRGLEIEAKISKSAGDGIPGLIEDGVLGAFSVGFRVKDADYIDETGGLRIKDAELFETSVVSVPCNQGATFSLAKSFDSMEEYKEFIKTFSVDLAGQTLAREEEKSSKVARNTPEQRANEARSEKNMLTPEELKALLAEATSKAADDAASKVAMKFAEDKAASEKAAAEKAAAEEQKTKQKEEIESAIKMGIESGADRLVKDFEAKLQEKDAKFDEVIAQFKADLEEKKQEIANMRESKRVFADRNSKKGLSDWGRDFMEAHLLGVVTGKGFNTEFAKDIFEKAGIDYATSAADIDQEVSRQIEKEVTLNLRTAQLFREIRVNGAATVLPIQPDVEKAVFQTGAAPSGNLQNRGAADNTYRPGQVILNAYRLISQTYMDNHIDEEVLVNLMPMLVDSVARAHARAVDNAIINGDGSITGLDAYATAGTSAATSLSIGGGDALTAAALMAARKDMGKYGINPSDLAYVVSMKRYYELIEDAAFADVTDVGSNVATKLTGMIGAVYGTPVIVSDSFVDEAASEAVAFAVNLRNYAIPRLRGVNVEQDYEVGNQRRVIVATQSLGFEELVEDAAGNRSAVKVVLAA